LPTDNEFTRILQWPSYRVFRHEIDEKNKILELWVRRKRGSRKPFLLVAPFFEETFSGATVAPGSATAVVFSVVVASAVFMVVNPFCALVGA
jgi:hypothetical protein